MYSKEIKRIADGIGVDKNSINVNSKITPGPSISVDVSDIPKQSLRLSLPTKKAFDLPTDLPDNGLFVYRNLCQCFTRQGYVAEGKTKDLLWGFNVSGIDFDRSAKGLIDLHRNQYILFRGPDGSYCNENSHGLGDCWIEYTQKLQDLVVDYSGTLIL